MKLFLDGHNCRYALEQLQMTLFPGEKPELCDRPPHPGEDGAISRLSRGARWLTASAKITWQGRTVRAQRRLAVSDETELARRRALQQSFYLAAVRLLPNPPAWGALSGVRPTKLTTAHLLQGGTLKSADRMLRDTFYVSPARRQLALEASQATVTACDFLRSGDISLYVGIPFCPTRCVYCSFVSQSIERHAHLLAPYLDALIREISYTGKLLADSPFRIRTIYIGGGTPTTLSAAQLARLMDALATSFDLSELLEYTVEGGRPDTLDREKLAVIRSHGAARVSINPQTMNDGILAGIGRRHTAGQTAAAVNDALSVGFAHINMDLIAGLPGENPDLFASSLDRVISMNPSNITVHTLALKKGAELFERRTNLPSEDEVARMLTYARDALRRAGYRPYYLYRQKYMSGSFENIGWCRDDDICLYNIYMMEEIHPVLSLGAGGMSKVTLGGGRLERFHNPKYPAQYLEQLDGVLAQKEEIFDLLRRQQGGSPWNF